MVVVFCPCLYFLFKDVSDVNPNIANKGHTNGLVMFHASCTLSFLVLSLQTTWFPLIFSLFLGLLILFRLRSVFLDLPDFKATKIMSAPLNNGPSRSICVNGSSSMMQTKGLIVLFVLF